MLSDLHCALCRATVRSLKLLKFLQDSQVGAETIVQWRKLGDLASSEARCEYPHEAPRIALRLVPHGDFSRTVSLQHARIVNAPTHLPILGPRDGGQASREDFVPWSRWDLHAQLTCSSIHNSRKGALSVSCCSCVCGYRMQLYAATTHWLEKLC